MNALDLLNNENRWRLKREFKSYFSLLFRKDPSTHRVLIFAQGRTGSTLLESLLESTGHFHGKGEVLGALNERVRFPIAYIKGLVRWFAKESIICHVKIYQLGQDRIEHGADPVDPKEFLKQLTKDGWRIIALHRSDKFDHYVSGCIARARRNYHKYDDQAESLKISIDRSELRQGMQNRKRLDLEEAAALEDIPHLKINYETDLSTPELQQATIARILDWLGLEQRKAHTKLRKINSNSRSDLIENYHEALAWSEEIMAS